MQLKLEWLHSRKSQLLSQLASCDTQVSQLFTQSTALTTQAEAALNEHKQKSQLTIKQLQKQVTQSNTQVKALESVILAKQGQIQRLAEQLAVASKGNHQKGDMVAEYADRIRHLEHALTVAKQQINRSISEAQKKIKETEDEKQTVIQNILAKHSQQLQEQQAALTKSHQEAITELKKVNLLLLDKIESQHEVATSHSTTLYKQTQSSYLKLTQQHAKLASTLNDYKSKLLDCEGSLNNVQQQLKLTQKESEIIKEQLKREMEMLKEERVELKARTRKLNEKCDELAWQVKELTMQKEQELRKVRQEVDVSFHMINTKATEELKSKENQLELANKQLQEKQAIIGQLEQMAIKLKNMVEQQEQQLAEKQQRKKNVDGQEKSQEQLKRELVRKNCEIQVLKQEIKRLKSKVNTIAAAYESHTRNQEQIQKENKMLLSEIVFLRQKEKQQKHKKPIQSPASSRFLNDLNSEQSQVCEDVDQYKKLIEFMTQDMNEAHRKLMQKDMVIDKLKEQIKRYESELGI